MQYNRMSKLNKFKVVFVGDQNVGKTSVISRFIQDAFDSTSNPTVGIDFVTKTMQIEGQTLRLQLWDTAGQERFRSLIPSYVRDADCCVIVFDLSNPTSFEGLNQWYDFVREQRGQDGLIVLLGNKLDLSNDLVNKKDIQKYGEESGSFYMEVSAKNGTNITATFRKISEKLMENKNGSTIESESVKIDKQAIVKNSEYICNC